MSAAYLYPKDVLSINELALVRDLDFHKGLCMSTEHDDPNKLPLGQSPEMTTEEMERLCFLCCPLHRKATSQSHTCRVTLVEAELCLSVCCIVPLYSQ